MSYDPYYDSSDATRPVDPYRPEPLASGDTAQIKGRVQGPAIALIVVGVLNLFFALYKVADSIYTTLTPAEELKANQMKVFEAMLPGLKAEVEKKTASEMKTQALIINWPLTLFAFLASILPIAGGIRMLSLKSYPLAICGAITAAIPCISITACCGAGEGIGIWALVVLLNADVKSAFR